MAQGRNRGEKRLEGCQCSSDDHRGKLCVSYDARRASFDPPGGANLSALPGQVKHSNGKTDKIKIHDGDKPSKLAQVRRSCRIASWIPVCLTLTLSDAYETCVAISQDFVNTHNLPPHYVGVLSQNIAQSIEDHKKTDQEQQEEQEERLREASVRRSSSEQKDDSSYVSNSTADEKSVSSESDPNREKHNELMGAMTKFREKLQKQNKGEVPREASKPAEAPAPASAPAPVPVPVPVPVLF